MIAAWYFRSFLNINKKNKNNLYMHSILLQQHWVTVILTAYFNFSVDV